EIESKFGDDRRTELMVGEIHNIDDEDLIEESNVIVTLTQNGYIKRIDDVEFRAQNRGGTGVKGMSMNDDDFVETMLSTSTHDSVLFFTNTGRVFHSKGYEIPEFGRAAKGIPVVNLLNLQQDETVQAMINVTPIEDAEVKEHLLFVTKNGTVKRTNASDYFNIRNNGLIALKLAEGDELVKVVLTSGDDNIIIASQDGYAVSFQETNVRSMGRTATGVRGIRLNDGDQVVGMSVLGPDDNVLVVTEKGYGKQTPASEYGIKNRGGKGVKTINVTEKNGILVGLTTVSGEEDIMLMTNQGIAIRFHAKNISQTGRATQG